MRLLPRADAAATSDAAATNDAGSPPADAGSDMATAPVDAIALPACAGLGDPIRLPTTSAAAGSACASALAARGHRFVLCSCEAMTAAARLRSEAFDSRDPRVGDDVSAAVGVSGGLQTTAEVRAGGALYVAGPAGVRASGHLESSRSLRVAGPLAMLSDMADVRADAYVAGDVAGAVRVDGALHVPAAAALGAGVEAASVVREPVTVPAPCDCTPGFAGAAATLAAAAAANHDEAAGISPRALAAVTAPARLDLPCGTYALDTVDAGAAITLAVHGRALLAVAGDVALGAGLTVELDPGAELDLVIGGRLTANGGAALGAPAGPARFRIWIAGSASVVLDDHPAVAATIHAPLAAVSAPGGLALSGSLLARSAAFGADTTLRFDRALFEAGAPCGEPPTTPVP